jgi:hypothetical protein
LNSPPRDQIDDDVKVDNKFTRFLHHLFDDKRGVLVCTYQYNRGPMVGTACKNDCEDDPDIYGSDLYCNGCLKKKIVQTILEDKKRCHYIYYSGSRCNNHCDNNFDIDGSDTYCNNCLDKKTVHEELERSSKNQVKLEMHGRCFKAHTCIYSDGCNSCAHWSVDLCGKFCDSDSKLFCTRCLQKRRRNHTMGILKPECINCGEYFHFESHLDAKEEEEITSMYSERPKCIYITTTSLSETKTCQNSCDMDPKIYGSDQYCEKCLNRDAIKNLLLKRKEKEEVFKCYENSCNNTLDQESDKYCKSCIREMDVVDHNYMIQRGQNKGKYRHEV